MYPKVVHLVSQTLTRSQPPAAPPAQKANATPRGGNAVANPASSARGGDGAVDDEDLDVSEPPLSTSTRIKKKKKERKKTRKKKEKERKEKKTTVAQTF